MGLANHELHELPSKAAPLSCSPGPWRASETPVSPLPLAGLGALGGRTAVPWPEELGHRFPYLCGHCMPLSLVSPEMLVPGVIGHGGKEGASETALFGAPDKFPYEQPTITVHGPRSTFVVLKRLSIPSDCRLPRP